MKAFIPHGNPRNQVIASHQVPPVNRGAFPDGTELRPTPIISFGELPDGTEVRQAPAIGFGNLPDGTEIRRCPVTYGT